jgi:hypothetical protein
MSIGAKSWLLRSRLLNVTLSDSGLRTAGPRAEQSKSYRFLERCVSCLLYGDLFCLLAKNRMTLPSRQPGISADWS